MAARIPRTTLASCIAGLRKRCGPVFHFMFCAAVSTRGSGLPWADGAPGAFTAAGPEVAAPREPLGAPAEAAAPEDEPPEP